MAVFKPSFSFFLLALLFLTSCSKASQDTPEPEPAPPAPSEKFIFLQYDNFQSNELVIVGSEAWGFIVSFKRELDGQLIDFEVVNDQLPVVLKSADGTEWDWFGKALSGPQAGKQLEITPSCMGYWFAFGALYPGADIFEGESRFEQLPTPNDPDWLIPTRRIARATSFDGIQAIDAPAFIDHSSPVSADADFYLEKEQLIVGVNAGLGLKAYPHAILDWHEVINDQLGGEEIAVVYCPLTGTATIWDRNLDSGPTTFGVSGLLYNSNVMPFDRSTESIWTQLDGRCVNGDLKGKRVGRYHFVETSWETWKAAYPTAKVMAEEQDGFSFDYRVYPYGDYNVNHQSISFPVEVRDDRLPAKERVHGIILNGKMKIYRFNSFEG